MLIKAPIVPPIKRIESMNDSTATMFSFYILGHCNLVAEPEKNKSHDFPKSRCIFWRGRLFFRSEKVYSILQGLLLALVKSRGLACLILEQSPKFQKFAQKPCCLAACEAPQSACQAGIVCAALSLSRIFWRIHWNAVGREFPPR